MRFSTILLIFAAIFWGTILGGIVYSHIVFFPVYFSNLPDSTVLVTGPYGLKDAYFWMILHPLLILSIVIALIINWNNRGRRRLLLFSAVLYAVVLGVTSLYFVPELIAFEESASSALTSTEWKRRTNKWFTFSIIRAIVMFIGIVPVLVALSRPAAVRA